MSLFIDKKFINMISPQLERFVWKKHDLANCRCKLCGDSHKNKGKARGYFYKKNNDMFYRCHNCGASHTIYKFLELIAPGLCKEYSLERWRNGEIGNYNYSKPKEEEQVFGLFKKPFEDKKKDCPLDTLRMVSELSDNHKCREFIELRQIPKKFWNILYYTTDFGKWAKKIDPDVSLEAHPRLVIPIYDTHGTVVAAQGRSLSLSDDMNARKTARYITLKGDKNIEKLWYGMERLDKDGIVYAFEGPLDSLFIPNSVAMIGINDGTNIPKPLMGRKLVFALDNEPRNEAVVRQLKKHIDLGHDVVIWDSSTTQKDVNDMVLAGISASSVLTSMKRNTCNGAEAKLRFQAWKKVTI
jgi:hypothetical protein